jgi:CheY-like chemotaxis protein
MPKVWVAERPTHPVARLGHPLASFCPRAAKLIVRGMQNAVNRTVVVIEDHPEHLDFVTTLLSRAGYAVAGFSTAQAALRYLAIHPASLVITDVFMPEMDGFEVLKELKRACLEVPVIAVTGIDRRQALFLDAMRHLGAHATFTKPVDAEALLGAVARLVGSPSPPPNSGQ